MKDVDMNEFEKNLCEVSENYLLHQKLEAEHREWAVSSLADYFLLFATSEDFQQPRDYVRVIHDFQVKSLPIIEEAISLTLDIIMGSEDLDTEE